MTLRPRALLLLLCLVASAALFGGCEDDSAATLTKPFNSPPWTGDEHLSYNLVERDGRVYGKCTLNTLPEFEPGKTKLERLCADEPHHDDGIAIVDSKTLQPFEASRALYDTSTNKKTLLSAVYEVTVVHRKLDDNGSIKPTDRDLPKPSKASPDPGYYDDASLYWLARGIPLQKGFSAHYANTNSPSGEVVTVSIKIESQERIRVPAGEFNSWKVRVETPANTVFIWVDDAAPHRMLRASAEQLFYELTAVN